MSGRKLPILPADHRAFVVVHELVSRNHLHYSLGVHGAKMYVMPQLGVRISWRERCKPGPRHRNSLFIRSARCVTQKIIADRLHLTAAQQNRREPVFVSDFLTDTNAGRSAFHVSR
jgi:hypothetical protein